MLKTVVEQRPDKSVNIYLGSELFKLSPVGSRDRLEWRVSTDHGFEPVSNPEVQRRMNRIWTEEVHCASHPPGPIPRFPRKPIEQVAELLVAAKKLTSAAK